LLDIFYKGELVDLAIPTEDFARGDIWYKWLNDKNINRYLNYGVYPNTRQMQEEFFNSIKQDKIVFVIQDKLNAPMGIVSLSFIDHISKKCELALFVDASANPKIMVLAPLEAVALVLGHAFELLGMIRISVAQHENLSGWLNRTELLGFRLEGIQRNSFVKGAEVSNAVVGAYLRSDYKEIVENRNGNLWDNSKNMLKRIDNLPKKSFRQEMDSFFADTSEAYYKKIRCL
jgi:hypothetical protein